MADWSITINDSYANNVIDAFAAEFNYDDLKQQDETKAQFAKRMLRERIKIITKKHAGVTSYENGITSARQAKETAEQNVEDNLYIT